VRQEGRSRRKRGKITLGLFLIGISMVGKKAVQTEESGRGGAPRIPLPDLIKRFIYFFLQRGLSMALSSMAIDEAGIMVGDPTKG
jgi:hypothetical protein